jgi:hypothetical protein
MDNLKAQLCGLWLTDGNPSYEVIVFRPDGKGFQEFIGLPFAALSPTMYRTSNDGDDDFPTARRRRTTRN